MYYIISGERVIKIAMKSISYFKRKDKGAAMRFFKRLLKGEGSTPLKVVTDKLASYSAAKKN